MDIVLQGNRQPVHEGGPRCDGVAVKHIRLLFDRNRDALLCKLLSQPLLLLFLYQYTSIVIQLQSSCLVSSNSTQSSISMLQLYLFYALLAGCMQLWHLHLPAWECEQASLAPSKNNLPTFSSASCAARKRLERCWFIFARGATPSATWQHRSIDINYGSGTDHDLDDLITVRTVRQSGMLFVALTNSHVQ